MKKNIGHRITAVIAFFLIAATVFFPRVVSAETIYGCAKNKILSFVPNKCPDGSRASEVKEGYVVEGDKVILDTLSDEEKKKLRINVIDNNKVIMVVYESTESGEMYFAPGRDRDGKELGRTLLELKYSCNEILAEKKLHKDCEPIEGSLKKARAVHKEKIDRMHLKQDLDYNKPKFYKQNRERGIADKEIDKLWNIYKENTYKRYNYDPVTDRFLTRE